jgi:hypothetical protein
MCICFPVVYELKNIPMNFLIFKMMKHCIRVENVIGIESSVSAKRLGYSVPLSKVIRFRYDDEEVRY